MQSSLFTGGIFCATGPSPALRPLLEFCYRRNRFSIWGQVYSSTTLSAPFLLATQSQSFSVLPPVRSRAPLTVALLHGLWVDAIAGDRQRDKVQKRHGTEQAWCQEARMEPGNCSQPLGRKAETRVLSRPPAQHSEARDTVSQLARGWKLFPPEQWV